MDRDNIGSTVTQHAHFIHFWIGNISRLWMVEIDL